MGVKNQTLVLDLKMKTGFDLYDLSTRDKRSVGGDDMIRKANHQAITYGKLRKDQEMNLQQQFNAIEKILPAPLAINLLSQIVLIAAVPRDFEVICPSQG